MREGKASISPYTQYGRSLDGGGEEGKQKWMHRHEESLDLQKGEQL